MERRRPCKRTFDQSSRTLCTRTRVRLDSRPPLACVARCSRSFDRSPGLCERVLHRTRSRFGAGWLPRRGNVGSAFVSVRGFGTVCFALPDRLQRDPLGQSRRPLRDGGHLLGHGLFEPQHKRNAQRSGPLYGWQPRGEQRAQHHSARLVAARSAQRRPLARRRGDQLATEVACTGVG